MTGFIGLGEVTGKKANEMLSEKGDEAASRTSSENEIILNWLPVYVGYSESFCDRCGMNRFEKRYWVWKETNAVRARMAREQVRQLEQLRERDCLRSYGGLLFL
jgi:hypothetical protein